MLSLCIACSKTTLAAFNCLYCLYNEQCVLNSIKELDLYMYGGGFIV